ncbi:30S ribosomal protein S2 [Candidatus Babeliales bacterium]|nr:30S ribosomal protein S2 [Candidatus Babeliales bacterium]
MALDLKQMLQAGIHFGHKTSRWDPRMRPFLRGSNNKTHLIDVSKTAFLLERAGKFIKEKVSKGGSLLIVGTKKAGQKAVEKAGKELAMPYIIHRWVGGTLSNFEQVRKAITRFLHLQDVVKKPLTNYKKKEIGTINKEIDRLNKNIGGIVDLDFPPAAVIIVDAKRESTAVKEASRLGIPIIALVDTNTDPSGINYIIPANDDSPRSIGFILDYIIEMAQEGKKLYAEFKKENPAPTAKEKTENRTAKPGRRPRKIEAKPEAKTELKSEVKVEAKSEPKVEVVKVKTVTKEATKKTEKKSSEVTPSDK